MKEFVLGDKGLHELEQCELKELHGGNPIINYVFNFLKSCVWDYVFSPTNGSQSVHPGPRQNPDGTYICTSDNA